MTISSIKVANSNQPSLTNKLEVGKHFEMTITQDNKTVVSVNTARTKYNSEMQQVRDGKMEYTSIINLRDKRYNSIMALANLDENQEDLSLSDLSKLNNLYKTKKSALSKKDLKKLEFFKNECKIKDVKFDGNAGKARIQFEDNTDIKIDVETENELVEKYKAKLKAKTEKQKAKNKEEYKKAKTVAEMMSNAGITLPSWLPVK